jgi:hypothetical protein
MISLLALSLAASQRVGIADITPLEPLPLGGYTARGDKKGTLGDERLQFRFTAIKQGDEVLLLGSADLLTMPETLVEEIERRLDSKVHLFLAATHTHSAPDSQMLNKRMNFKIPGIAAYSRKWTAWFADQAADAANRQISLAQPAGNIRIQQVSVEANRGRRKGAKPIKTATRVWMDKDVIFSSYSAHGTVRGETHMTFSGDWLGSWAHHAGGLVFAGAIGDVSPSVGEGTEDQRIDEMVHRLETGLGGAEKVPIGQGMAFASEPIKVAPPTPHPDFASSNGVNSALAKIVVGKFAPPDPAISAFRLGTAVVVGVPAEPSSALAQRIMRAGDQLGFSQTIVVSHVNGWMGYILEPFEYWRGGYEATLMLHGPSAADRTLEAAKRAITRLR